ncbi:MAG: PTS-dependent dihydroxyacetone kinase operon transcriptional regulator DhaR [Anaerolineae bacterium]|uniref:dihydroxyacetone kinase operon transcriptional regulator DhaR n=1 Tax=Promineifilum sp. TaxID=2664178 RepID=UPI001D3F7B57|nr:PTS-dependent dihydroxyacetone kinase operon transcriptional regulator DhaR [Anaerolineales bacterium]MCO5181579.1 dihydroxyacetone kinase operon transcriptional regulator DhaR [Promineifilum sp.]MCW5846463.1 PTS-dependent dihydroxyacetone kinase operon transcriptional regulator DhaR [Anaerolineae bacterium]
MIPADIGVRNEATALAWRSFIETGRLDAIAAAQIDPAVVRSWRRCVYRFNPLVRPRLMPIGRSALYSIVRAQQELITIATPFVEDIHQFTEGSNYAVVLTDGAGCLLLIGGDPAAVERATAVGFQQGTYWSENNAGTNAFGLVLLEAMPMQVVGAEHYFNFLHGVITAAAPIHDVRGRIIGLLGMTGPLDRPTSHTLGLVMSAARAIGNQLQANWFLEEANQHLSQVNTILGAITEGVIVWNQEGEIRHVNQQAARMLRINPRTVVGRPLADVFHLPPELMAAIEEGSELHDVELSIQVNDQDIRVVMTLRPILEAGAQPLSYVALINPVEHVRQIAQRQYGAQTGLSIESVQAESSSMRRVVRQSRTAARGLAPVLILGEGGVGKNLLARAIHNESPRAGKPFIDINCRAIPHELMTREILGHEQDTHTRGQPSKFELADGGTLLLDQIENLSLELQAALLHVIETRHVTRLGSSAPIPVDVRIIAATTANLEELVAQNSFMSHLYYRFGVFKIEVPPLRERVEDIPLLAEHFLARHTDSESRAIWIEDEAVGFLIRYPWPGNVRELESVLERAMSQSHNNVIRPADLPEMVRNGRVLVARYPLAQPVLSVDEAEREAILRAGWACQGRVTEMARLLGIGRSTLWRKMKRLEISATIFKQ